MLYSRRKNFIKKFYKNYGLKTSTRHLSCLQRIKHNFYWKMKFLKQATYIRYVIAKLLKFAQTACRAPQNLFTEGSWEI